MNLLFILFFHWASQAQIFDLDDVSFLKLKQEILAPVCSKCHKWITDEKQLEPFIEPGIPEESKIYQKVAMGLMPPGNPLSEEEVELFKNYILSLESDF